MSDLGGGRTSNGGPVPVPATNAPAGLNKPSDVMRNRRMREAKRQEEEQRRAEERRRSAERRAAAATTEPRYSAASSQYTPDMSTAQDRFPSRDNGRLSGTGYATSGADPGASTGRATADPSSASRRGAGSSQAQEQPRPAPGPSTSRRPAASSRPSQPQPTYASGSASAAQPESVRQPRAQPAESSSGGRASAFPHAFERWEQMSAHWEGLTSYWLRKLETHAEEITQTVPSAASMSRQINDLSAAGANLFHAVVELQRLRASSERKFQRWFFETRADTERLTEIKAQLEQQVQAERAERERIVRERADIDSAAEKDRRDVADLKRELMISKEEARRAWEELGRRNQETLELAESLKAGKPTIVSGVQVMPMWGGPSRTASASHRPATREGVSQYEATPSMSAAAGLRSPGDERDYYREDVGGSPTNTDPFIESSRAQHHEPAVQSLATGTYQPYAQASDQRPVASSSSQRQPNITAAEAERFYQQGPQGTFLHSPGVSAQRLQQETPRQTRGAYHAPLTEEEAHTESDDYEADGDAERQREMSARYGLGSAAHPTALTQIPPEAPSVPATSAAAMAIHGSTAGAEDDSQHPDYEGADYGDWALGPRGAHQPTRLSDVLEEEEERSSRRTAE